MMYVDKTLRVSAHRSPRGELVLREDAQGAYGVDDAEKLAADCAAVAKKHKLPFSGDFYVPKAAPSLAQKAFQTGKAPEGWSFCLLKSVCKRKADGRKFSKPTLALLLARDGEVKGSGSTKLL